MTGAGIRGNLETDRHTERRPREHEDGHWQAPGKDRNTLSSQPVESADPTNDSVSGFWPPDLRENTFLLCRPLSLWCAVMGAPRKLIPWVLIRTGTTSQNTDFHLSKRKLPLRASSKVWQAAACALGRMAWIQWPCSVQQVFPDFLHPDSLG